jgi:TatD DNase family protein
MNYRIIDTHCHPQFPQYDIDRSEVIDRALKSGIGMVCVGTNLDSSRAAINLAVQYEGLYASVGLHPNDELDSLYDEREYEKIAAHPKVVAIGEIGLDHYRTPSPEHRRTQRARFVNQLAMARRMSLPVIIHCRDAHEDMTALLEKEGKGIRGVIHSFNGSVAQARTYTDAGLYLGFNAIVTYAPAYEEMVKSVPMNRILLETDAPYLAPAPYRGRRNDPSYIEGVGNYLAQLKGISVEELLAATTENAKSLLDI